MGPDDGDGDTDADGEPLAEGDADAEPDGDVEGDDDTEPEGDCDADSPGAETDGLGDSVAYAVVVTTAPDSSAAGISVAATARAGRARARREFMKWPPVKEVDSAKRTPSRRFRRHLCDLCGAPMVVANHGRLPLIRSGHG